MTTRLYHLAKRQAFERIAETCPAVHTEGTSAIAAFHSWLNKRSWMDKLSEKEALRLEVRIGEFVADLFSAMKENGTIPLRAALIETIHENMLLALSPERIALIEAGQDADAEALA